MESEQAAAQGMLDEQHPQLPAAKGDTNTYRLGRIGDHNVVIAILNSGVAGITAAAVAATNLLRSFPNVRFGLMVGIGGGASGKPSLNPKKDIHLGDVVVSSPSGEHSGVVQYDLGKSLQDGRFVRSGSLNSPPAILGTAVSALRGDAQLNGYQIKAFVEDLVEKYPDSDFEYPGDAADKLFASDYIHVGDDDCTECADTGLLPRRPRKDSSIPVVHYGLIGSANRVLRDSTLRDKLRQELGIICFEMEAGGLMNDFPCLVIRGISDYSDSHKNKLWQPYAAATAASYAKELLGIIQPEKLFEEKLAREVISTLKEQTVVISQLKDITARVESKLDFSGLPNLPNAAFDSHVDFDEQDSTCLPGTRVEILQTIQEWAMNPESKLIYWLNGMAGTGKSTISRSVAQFFAQREQLGASFFFKRGEGDRESAKYLFTTLAAQLSQSLPPLRITIRAAIDKDPNIGHKALKEQFEKLVLAPINDNADEMSSPVVIVIDALDECADQDKLQMIIGLLSKLQSVRSIRILLTSRREQVLDWTFGELHKDNFQDIVLHEISETTIDQDITTYLKHRFNQIRARKQRELPRNWPGDEALEALTALSSPLFVFASTICRFIGDWKSDPISRLQSVLARRQTTNLDKIYEIYQTILVGVLSLPTDEREEMLSLLRSLIGTVVVLIEPLPKIPMCRLLNISYEKANNLLGQLSSILRVPADIQAPIRTLHASFGDFLLHEQWRDKHSFWIDASEVHWNLGVRCLELLLRCSCLAKQDICGLKTPGIRRKNIDVSLINEKIPVEVQYASTYWIRHLANSNYSLSSLEDRIHELFKERFLYWLEALSLLGKAFEANLMLSNLSVLISDSSNLDLIDKVHDTKRFMLANCSVSDMVPLQLYSSCFIFAPQQSPIRTHRSAPRWLKNSPKIQENWGSILQNMRSNALMVESLAFSPGNGDVLAAGADDGSIELWSTSSGFLQQTLHGHSNIVTSLAFSPTDGKLLASGSVDYTILLWNILSAQIQQTLEGHYQRITCVTFSPDGTVLASSSRDHTVKIWDVNSGQIKHTLEGHSNQVNSIVFSPHEETLLSCSNDFTIRLWDANSTKLQQVLEQDSSKVQAAVFSPGGKLMASTASDGTIKLWDIISGQTRLRRTLKDVECNSSLFFFADDKMLVFLAIDNIKFFNVSSDPIKLEQSLAIYSDWVTAAAFLPSRKLIATGSGTGSIKLLDATLGSKMTDVGATEHEDTIHALCFSNDGTLLASIAGDNWFKLWDVLPDGLQFRSRHYVDSRKETGVAISPNGIMASCGSRRTICLVNVKVNSVKRLTIDGYVGNVECLAFSADSKLLVSGHSGHSSYFDGVTRRPGLQLWEVDSRRLLGSVPVLSYPSSVACSLDGKLLASCASDWSFPIELYETASGRLLRKLEAKGYIHKLSFQADPLLLCTNLGAFDLSDLSERSEPPTLNQSSVSRFDRQGDWITCYGQELFFLPYGYRNVYTSFDFHGDRIALAMEGVLIGRVLMLQISVDELIKDGLIKDPVAKAVPVAALSKDDGKGVDWVD